MTALPLVIVGATASGKSDLAVSVAHQIGAEVINTDSMQLYQGMDIGTGKLTDDQRAGVPHHLLDVWPITHTATVVEFRQLVYGVLDDLRMREIPAVLVGGSGMYVQAVVDNWDFPGTDAAVRAAIEERLGQDGVEALYEELQRSDPTAAAAIQPTNARRIVRALEVVQLRGSFKATLPQFGTAAGLPCTLVGLSVAREVLDERIASRVDSMWAAGWVEEVRGLERLGLRHGRTASRALGYQQILRYLAGECSEVEARAETVRATRRFARRQESWFRRDPRVRWLTSESDVSRLAEELGQPS